MKTLGAVKASVLAAVVTVGLLVIGSVGAYAATYYVSPTGSDGSSGTSGAPFKTIQKAANIVNPGDTVIVRDGVYTSTTTAVVTISRAGTASQPITFFAENKGGAVIDGGNYARTYGLNFADSAAYIEFDGFEIRYIGAQGVFLQSDAHHITLRNCEIHHVNYRQDCNYSCGDSTCGRSGIYASGVGARYYTIDSCIFHHIGRLPQGGCSEIYYNHDHGLYVDSSDVTVINSIFYEMKSGWPLAVSNGAANWTIVNNTFVGANPGRDGHIFMDAGNSNLTIQNNISYSPTNYFIRNQSTSGDSGSIRNNLVYGASLAEGSTCSAMTCSGNITGQDPKFADRVNNDFHLQADSPARDKGIDIPGYDYDAEGNAIVGLPDIGAYEYSDGTTPPPPPPSDTTSPTVPAGLTATTVSSSQINLSWTASTDNRGVSGYEVYRNTNLIATVTTPSYSDTGRSPSTTYSYKVSAFDGAGNTSAQSAAVTATTPSQAIPDTLSPATEIIVDNSSSGTSYTGTWGVSSGTNPYGANSLWSRDGATYKWRANLPKGGKYKVYAWWTAYSSRATSVPIKISYSGGSKTVYVNQQQNGGKWNYLGTFSFTVTAGGTVVLSAPGTDPKSYCADAVKFVYVP